MLVSRGSIKNCVFGMSGVGSLAIQFARSMKVVALETDEDKLQSLQKNSEIYEVTDKLFPTKGDIINYVAETKSDIVVLNPEITIKKGFPLRLNESLPNLSLLIERSLKISNSVVVVFPSVLDPVDLIENIENLDVGPCLEIILLFNNTHLKNIAFLIGSLTKFDIGDIVIIVLSKLGLSSNQRGLILDSIHQISLKRVLEILEEVEKEAQSGSLIERIRHKSKRFFEVLREEGMSLNNLIFLHKGKDGDSIIHALDEHGLYYIELESRGNSFLEIDGNKIIGKDNILHYLEELKIQETPNKNSLFLLIGT